MLGLSALTAGTLAAGATGTLAWFTTNKTATATYGNIIAQSTSNKIKLEIQGITDTNAKGSNVDEEGNFNEIATATSQLSYTSDVSSKEGKTFVKPVWEGQAANSAKVSDLKTLTAKDNAFTQYYIKVTNQGAVEGNDNKSGSLNIFLNDNTAITPTAKENSKDIALANWTRVSVLDAGEAIPTSESAGTYTLKTLFEKNEGNTTSYVSGINAVSNTLDIKQYTEEEEKLHKTTDFTTVTTSTTTTDNPAFLGKLEAGKSRYFMISVWLEGTEADNQDAAIGGSISVSLGFTGIEVA